MEVETGPEDSFILPEDETGPDDSSILLECETDKKKSEDLFYLCRWNVIINLSLDVYFEIISL